MPLVRVGTLPISALNIGLAGVPPALGAKVAKIGATLSQFTAGLQAAFTMKASFPPNLPGYAASFASALNPVNLAANFNPANWVTANASANIGLVARLALIEAQIAIVTLVVDGFRAGLDVGGLAGWTYAGSAAGFGSTLQGATATGFGRTAADANIQALVIATNAFSGWQAFGSGFNVGSSARADLGSAPANDRLNFLGELTGGAWNTGLAAHFADIDLLLAELHATASSIQGQIELSLGLHLPDPVAIVRAGLAINLTAALGNLVNIQTDLTGSIGALQAQIDATLTLAGSISASLSGGGLTFWTYSGAASGLGSALAAELASGLPGAGQGPTGPAYGLAIASTPTAMGAFGSIFKTS